jgi:hypothetical protein
MKMNFIILSLSNQLEEKLKYGYPTIGPALNYQAKSDMFALS